jgi:hypothetical protein
VLFGFVSANVIAKNCQNRATIFGFGDFLLFQLLLAVFCIKLAINGLCELVAQPRNLEKFHQNKKIISIQIMAKEMILVTTFTH